MKINLVARIGYVKHLPCKHTSYLFIIDDGNCYYVTYNFKRFFDFYSKDSYTLDKVIKDLNEWFEIVEIHYFDKKAGVV